MIKRIIRLLGFALMSFALYTLITTPMKLMGELWKEVHFKSLQLIQPALERHIAVWLWDPVLLSIILTPAWIVCAILAIPLLYFGMRRKI